MPKDIYVAPDGSDTNTGTRSSPYRTLFHAGDVAASGDRIVLRGGTYKNAVDSTGDPVDKVTFFDGRFTAHNLTIMAEPGEIPVITGTLHDSRAFWLFTRNDITLDGLTFRDIQRDPNTGNSVRKVIDIAGGSRLTVQNCTFQNLWNPRSGFGVAIEGGTDHVIRNNRFDLVGDPSGTGSGDCVNLNVGAQRVVIEGNYFSRAGHGTLGMTKACKYVVIRNNTFERCWTHGPGWGTGTAYVLVEKNLIRIYAENSSYTKTGMQVAGDRGIVRKNRILFGSTKKTGVLETGLENRYAMLLTTFYESWAGRYSLCRDNQIYQNTLYRCGREGLFINQKLADPSQPGQPALPADAGTKRNRVFDNIVYFTSTGDTSGDRELMVLETYHDQLGGWGADFNGNQFYNNIFRQAVWDATNQPSDRPNEPNVFVYIRRDGTTKWSLAQAQSAHPSVFFANKDANPGFVDLAGENLALAATSPAIDAGVAAATTTAAGTSTTSVPVTNCFPFYSGWSIPGEVGDLIQVGTNAPVRLTAISYPAEDSGLTTGTLTVATAITFASGDGVHIVYQGNAPDMGAIESGETVDPTPPPPEPPPPSTEPPPAPTVDGPILNGATQVTGTGQPGAVAEVFVNNATRGTTPVDAAGRWAKTGLSPALVTGEVVTATQTKDGLTSAVSNSVTVAPATTGDGGNTTTPGTGASHPFWFLAPFAWRVAATVTTPAAPGVDSPLIAGAVFVTGTGVATATVEVFVDGVSKGTTTVASAGTWTKAVSPALVAGQVVTATQTRGGLTSALSAGVTVTAPPASGFMGRYGRADGVEAPADTTPDAGPFMGRYGRG